MRKSLTKTPKIALTGGGSGGHITPILSVARAVGELSESAGLYYIGQKGDDLADILLESAKIDEVYRIRAGKWRRYHGESFWQHLVDFKTVFLNIRDIFYLVVGIFQAYWTLLRLKPDSLFIKGGYVGLPVGIAAKIRGIPFATHDSDAIPGLSNKLIGRWASWHATGMPKGLYNYPKDKTVYTGIPVADSFWLSGEDTSRSYKKTLDIKNDEKMILVVGGGLGAVRLNEVVLEIIPKLLKNYTNLHLINITGRGNKVALDKKYQSALSPSLYARVKLIDFTNELYLFSGAADIVIMRAGATNMAEMAAQGKACILVPNPVLTGGHQVKNAKTWEDAEAALVYDEARPAAELQELVVKLLEHPSYRETLSKNSRVFAKRNASKQIAKLLIDMAANRK